MVAPSLLRYGLCARQGVPDTRGGTKDFRFVDCSPPSTSTASSVLPGAIDRRDRIPLRESGALRDAARELNLLRGSEAEGANAFAETESERKAAAAAPAPSLTILANPNSYSDLLRRGCALQGVQVCPKKSTMRRVASQN